MSQPHDPTSPTPAADDEPDDAMAAKLFDYAEGTLAEADRAEVEAYLAARGELPADIAASGAKLDLGALRRAPAPAEFTEGVTKTIHTRSAGRFFARRTFGDRVPLGLLLAVALAALLVIFAILRSSPTGSLGLGRRGVAPAPPAGSLAPPL